MITPPKVQFIHRYRVAGILTNTDVTEDFSSWNAFSTEVTRDALTAAYILIN